MAKNTVINKGIGFVVLLLVVLVACFLISAALFMVLANVIMHRFGLRTFDFGSAMASVALLGLYVTSNRANKDNG